MRTNKVDSKIWHEEVKKYKNACQELGRTIKCTELKHKFMGLKCYSWYPENAPDELNICSFTDFLNYLGESVYYEVRLTKEYVINYVKDLQLKLNRSLKLSDFDNDKNVKRCDILYYFGSFNNMNNELGFKETGTYKGHAYSKEELVEILQTFYKDTGIIPSSSFFEHNYKKYNLPSRKTFTRVFGVDSWKNVLELCGLDTSKIQIYGKHDKRVHDDKDFIINLINRYIEENNEVPTMRGLNNYYGTELKTYVKKYFGSWNNCLKELGLKLNSISHYTDEELDDAFISFIDEFDRVPTIQDFNKTGRPSFWCYQQRFGSWAEACMHYGYKPNYRKPHYYMDDGERCDSHFEYDISTWLKSKGITYDRDVPYIDFTNNYKGKMNCDYRFTLDDGQVWFVEMAGFIDTDDFTKLTSREEELYFFKLKYKKKLFIENNLNYKIFHPSDLKNHTMEELFDFLNIKKTA